VNDRDAVAERKARRLPDPEHLDLLAKRAQALGTENAGGDDEAGEIALAFTLSGERYALAARVIQEVVALRNLTPLPVAAAPLFGITHWRGVALTILDIRDHLNLPTGGVTDLGRVIVLDAGREPFGIVVDAVHDVVSIVRRELQRLPHAAEEETRAVVGATPDGILLLDEEYLLGWVMLGDRMNRQTRRMT
jgi:purine-binding chemotaxis protein CheW